MSGFKGWIRAAIIAGVAVSAAACASYPDAPRYSTRPTTPAGQPGGPPPPGTYAPPPPAYEPPPPATAPTERIDGGALPPPASTAPPAGSAMAGVTAYVIQPGDTLSGVGRRFRTPIQTLIDMNNLGPRGAISQGQSILLPPSAVDAGVDPYATGPSPVGVVATNEGVPPPPPPPPPSGNPPAPPPVAIESSTLSLQWPVRGDIVRRFGPVGMGERNNGINIGAAQGAPVVAAAPGRVAYVGDDLVGQGLTVLLMHRDGWRTVYGHLGSATVRDGEDVRAGQQIGTVGTTAGDGRPSIHFETRHMRNDEPVAIDPVTVLPR